MPELTRKLIWLIGIRLLVVLSVALAYYLSHLGGGSELDGSVADTLTFLVALVCVQSLVYIALLRFLRHAPKAHAYVQFTGDLLLITLLIYQLGEGAGSFSILYLVVISVAAALLRRSAALIVAGLAFVFYGGSLALARFPSLLERLGVEAPPAPEAITGGMLTYNLAIHLLGFYLVAVMTSYLARGVTRAEEQLREKHHDLAYLQVLHRDVIQSISSGLATTDLEGRVTSLNRAGEAILGTTEQRLLGEHISSSGLLGAEEWREHTKGAEQGVKARFESIFERGSEAIYVGFSLSPLRDGDGTEHGYILNFQDLTEWRQLQEQLRRNDRMAAIGQTAAGLAHEIGNPLAAISGAVQMLGSSFAGGEEERKLLDITVKESQRLDRTVKSFLRFARPRERTTTRFDVAALLSDSVQLLRSSETVAAEHEIVAELDPPSAMVHADPDLIRQVFWNLSSNALRAMPQGGRLTVSGHLEEGFYRIRFRDTGSGMTEEERTGLFQPFRSFFDGGTGLGMAIVYSIIKEHGGETHVDSSPGQGSVITVDLPLSGKPAAAAREVMEP